MQQDYGWLPVSHTGMSWTSISTFFFLFCIQVLLDQRNRTRKSPDRPFKYGGHAWRPEHRTPRGEQSRVIPPVVPGPVSPPPPATASRAPRRSPFRPQMEPKKSSVQRQPHAMEPNKSSPCGATATAPAATTEAESPLCSLFYPPAPAPAPTAVRSLTPPYPVRCYASF
jgi:hypothetical protein